VCGEHKLLDERLVCSLTCVTVHRGSNLDHNHPDSNKGGIHAHENNNNIELLHTPGAAPDFNLAVSDRNTIPNVHCAEEGITVQKSDSAVDHKAYPQDEDGPPSFVPAVGDTHSKLFEGHLETGHEGTDEPASVDRHSEPENEHFKHCELAGERSFLHDESCSHQGDHDHVCAGKSGLVVGQEDWKPESVKEQISAEPPANLVEYEIVGSGGEASTTLSRKGLVDHEDEKWNVDKAPDSYSEGSWSRANIDISRDPSEFVRKNLGCYYL